MTRSGVVVRTRAVGVAVALLALVGCSSDLGPRAVSAGSTSTSSTMPTTTSSTVPRTTTTTTPRPASTTSTTEATLPPTTLPPTTLSPTTLPPTTLPPGTTSTFPGTTLPPLPPAGNGLRIDTPAPELPALTAWASSLAEGNLAVSVTVLHDGERVFGGASGRTVDGGLVTTETAFVTASVSKLVTALTIARLVQDGRIVLEAPVPWSDMGIAHDPAWDDVTLRELLSHTSGMPIARKTWLDLPGSCSIPLTEAMAIPPREHRGTWTYSNGNYCALGLLIEQITGLTRDAAAQLLVFDPASIEGPHLSTLGALPDDAPYANGVARLERLGGAGTWLASTDDLAAMLAAVTPEDLETLRWPGIITDQYGWGHTGTVDGAKACAWVMDGGRTIVTAVVSGNRPATGGGVCNVLETGLAVDLGEYAGDPVRSPD